MTRSPAPHRIHIVLALVSLVSTTQSQGPGAVLIDVAAGTASSARATAPRGAGGELQLAGSPQDATYLKASNTDPDDRFGYAVAITGSTSTLARLVVGALLEDSDAVGVDGDESSNSATDPGAAYVFEHDGSTWSKTAYLKASNTGDSDRFGGAVAISGPVVAVGARLEDTAAVNSGAAYVFSKAGFLWAQDAFLKAPYSDASDEFGNSIAVDVELSSGGNTIVVGAYREDSGFFDMPWDNSAPDSGAAWIYTGSGGKWVAQIYVKPLSLEAFDEFGTSLALWGDILVVGAPGDDSDADGVNGDAGDNSAPDAGAAYVFQRLGGSWVQTAYLKATNSDAGDLFGTQVALLDDRILVGAPGEDGSGVGVDPAVDEAAPDSGAAYAFRRIGLTWVPDGYIKATNTDAGDAFGSSVALSPSLALIGAPGEASDAIGPFDDQSDNSKALSGAVYAYGRHATGWFPSQYVKAPNTDSGDEFGSALAASRDEDALLVGARYEDGASTGVDQDLFSNTSRDAGAAYVVLLEPEVSLYGVRGQPRGQPDARGRGGQRGLRGDAGGRQPTRHADPGLAPLPGSGDRPRAGWIFVRDPDPGPRNGGRRCRRRAAGVAGRSEPVRGAPGAAVDRARQPGVHLRPDPGQPRVGRPFGVRPGRAGRSVPGNAGSDRSGGRRGAPNLALTSCGRTKGRHAGLRPSTDRLRCG